MVTRHLGVKFVKVFLALLTQQFWQTSDPALFSLSALFSLQEHVFSKYVNIGHCHKMYPVDQNKLLNKIFKSTEMFFKISLNV